MANTEITRDQGVGYTGVSYPFRFGKRGGVVRSTTTVYAAPHILESIQQIWGTNKYEREMRPELYGDLDRMPFEPMPSVGETSLAHFLLTKAVERWDERVEIRQIEIVDNSANTLQLRVEVEILSTRQVVEWEIELTR